MYIILFGKPTTNCESFKYNYRQLLEICTNFFDSLIEFKI